jgi:hypothetical protein
MAKTGDLKRVADNLSKCPECRKFSLDELALPVLEKDHYVAITVKFFKRYIAAQNLLTICLPLAHKSWKSFNAKVFVRERPLSPHNGERIIFVEAHVFCSSKIQSLSGGN